MSLTKDTDTLKLTLPPQLKTFTFSVERDVKKSLVSLFFCSLSHNLKNTDR